jgi:peptidase M28-like protein
MKRMRMNSILALVVALPLVAAGADRDAALSKDPDISSILSRVDGGRILDTATTLQNFRTRQSCSDTPEPGHGVTPARDFLFSQYSAISGLQVRLDPFIHSNCPTSPTFNVIAWLPGRDPNRLVIIGGHYDSRTTNVLDNTSDAPGGNDAGAQTGVVLELARVFAGHQFDATVVFMSFSGEEQGLFGSHSIAANLNRYFEDPRVVVMLNTDIPGGDNTANTAEDLRHFRLYSPGIPRERLSTDPDGSTDNTSPSRGVMRYVGTWGGAYVPSLTMTPEMREDRPGRSSDHASFISQAYPAVRFMETFECSPSPQNNSCGSPLPCPPPAQIPAFCKDTSFITTHQHSPNDLVQYVTPHYAARIARVMAAVAASLARAPGSPQNFTASGNATQGISVKFDESEPGNHADHYVVAARSISENFYRQRVTISHHGEDQVISPQALGLNPGDSFYVSVSAVDRQGHESLFAYPEVRCDSTGCAIPSYAYNVTSPLPPPPPAKDPAEDD